MSTPTAVEKRRSTPTSGDTSQWSMEDKKKLLHAVVEIGGTHVKSHKAAESSLKWENIKVDGKSAEECKATYQKLIGKVRKYRTLPEVVADALVLVDEPGKLSDEYPDMPKKPPTAFSLFVMKRSKKFPDIKGTKKMTVFASHWNELSEEKKESYKKKYLKLKKKYEEELEVFRQNHPEFPPPGANSNSRPNPPLPSRLFMESHIDKLKNKQPELSHAEAVKILMNKYRELPDKKKLKWIKKAMSSRQTYQDKVDVFLAHNPKSTTKPALLHLSKEEERIWHSSRGKPVPAPPKNVFQFFCNTKRDTVHHLGISEQSRGLSALYHKLTEEEVKDLTKLFKKEVEEYVQAYTHYYNSLPQEERADEKAPEEALAAYSKILQESPKKKKKSKSKKPDVDDANDKKVKLSDLPPRPVDESDSDSDGEKSLQESPKKKKKSKSKKPDVDDANDKKVKLSDLPPQPTTDESDNDSDGEPRKRKVPTTPASGSSTKKSLSSVLTDKKTLASPTVSESTKSKLSLFSAPEKSIQESPKKKKKSKSKKPDVDDANDKKVKLSDLPPRPVDESDSDSDGEESSKKKKKSKSKQAEVDDTNVKKVSLSNILPRPAGDSDSDSDGSLPSSGMVASAKRKGAPLDQGTPQKKSKHVPVVPTQNDVLGEDAMLSPWTPKTDNDTLPPAEGIDTPKRKSKKAKTPKA